MIYFYDLTYNDYFQTILLQPTISYTTPLPPPPYHSEPEGGRSRGESSRFHGGHFGVIRAVVLVIPQIYVV